MRTAVIGCSHSAGYSFAGAVGDKDRWLDNNWAEFYINNQNKDGAIFACPGRGWYDYSERLAFLFKHYNDIDEVIIQQTYWNRFRLGFHNPCHYENIVPLERHMMKEETHDKIDCWNIQMWLDKEQSFDGGRITVKGDYAIDPVLALRWEPFDVEQPHLQSEGYQRIKAWYELMTITNQRAFFKEVYLWNQLCKDNKAKLKIFAINDITHLPKDLNMIGDCNYGIVADKTVDQFLTEQGLETNFIDDEHYTTDVHKLIADKFIPQIERN